MKFNRFLPSVLIASSVAVATSILPAQAVSLKFADSDAGGKASARMEFSGLKTRSVMVDLFNISPTKLQDNSGFNTPAITKFGFDNLGSTQPIVKSWELKASDSNKQFVTLGSSMDDSLPWHLDFSKKLGKLTLTYRPETANDKGGIYSAKVIGSLGDTPNAFTKASLSLNFRSGYTLDKNSAFVRLKNLGTDGVGTVKAKNKPYEEVPEPMTILGSAAALGFGTMLKKQADKKKNQAVVKEPLSV